MLGLRPGASEDKIRAAHRRLMRAAHPDSGGSDWMAARVNQARDILLGQRRAAAVNGRVRTRSLERAVAPAGTCATPRPCDMAGSQPRLARQERIQ